MKGFKIFDRHWMCRTKRFECPGVYVRDYPPEVNWRGIHFCKTLADCFRFNPFTSDCKVAEVEAFGELSSFDGLYCTNGIRIVREVPWSEVLDQINTGKDNDGIGNTGHRNSGDQNSGSSNAGHYNTGDLNAGSRNTGAKNSGIRNSGSYNAGSWNSGDLNSGDCNSGNRNSGDYNTGFHNSGDHNTGDFNSCDWATGCFCSKTQPFYMFNQPCAWLHDDWAMSKQFRILRKMPLDPKDRKDWWDSLPQSDRRLIRKLPNYDPGIFFETTGILDTEEEV